FRATTFIDRHPAAPADGSLHHSRDAGRLFARIALRSDRLRPMADDPDLSQPEAVQRPGPDLAQRRRVLRLHPPLLSLPLGLVPGGGDPDDAGGRGTLRLTCRAPESGLADAGGATPLGAGRRLRRAARHPLPARSV